MCSDGSISQVTQTLSRPARDRSCRHVRLAKYSKRELWVYTCIWLSLFIHHIYIYIYVNLIISQSYVLHVCSWWIVWKATPSQTLLEVIKMEGGHMWFQNSSTRRVRIPMLYKGERFWEDCLKMSDVSNIDRVPLKTIGCQHVVHVSRGLCDTVICVLFQLWTMTRFSIWL